LLAYLAALVGMMALAEANKLRLKFWWCDPIVAYKMPSSFLWLGWTLFIFSVDLLRYSFSSVWDKMTNLYSSPLGKYWTEFLSSLHSRCKGYSLCVANRFQNSVACFSTIFGSEVVLL
jgi:hypothetical protein